MSLLHNVEVQLGPIDIWPSYVIEYLFVTTPSPQVVKALTSFFFGNGVPPAMAYRLYRACSQTSEEAVRHMFYEWYFLWHSSLYIPRLTVYYNMQHKRMVYLSGSHCARFGPIPVLGVPTANVGIDNTSCPLVILSLLQHVRRV